MIKYFEPISRGIFISLHKKCILTFCLVLGFGTIFCQERSNKLLGYWSSIDGNNIVLEFNTTIEKRYHLTKAVKIVPQYNIESISYSIKDSILHEHQPGGGGINMDIKFKLENDTLKMVYRNKAFVLKRIRKEEFQKLIGTVSAYGIRR